MRNGNTQKITNRSNAVDMSKEDQKLVNGEPREKRKYTGHAKVETPEVQKNNGKATSKDEKKATVKDIKEARKEVKEPKNQKVENKAVKPVEKTQENTKVAKDSVMIKDVLATVDPEKVAKIAWYNEVPKRDRYITGDVIFFEKADKFGYFIKPARKAGLLQIRILKEGSKAEVYTRDWFVKPEDVELVKRAGETSIKRGFGETNEEFTVKGRKATAE